MVLCSAALPTEQREVRLSIWSCVDAAACANLPVLRTEFVTGPADSTGSSDSRCHYM